MPIWDFGAAQLQEGRPTQHGYLRETSEWHLADTAGIRVQPAQADGRSLMELSSDPNIRPIIEELRRMPHLLGTPRGDSHSTPPFPGEASEKVLGSYLRLVSVAWRRLGLTDVEEPHYPGYLVSSRLPHRWDLL